MQISPISYNYNPNFNGQSRILLDDGSKAVIDLMNNSKGKIERIDCNVWYKMKNVQQFTQSWADGIEYDNLLFSDFAKNLAERLKLNQETAEEKVGDAIFEAYYDEVMPKEDDTYQ